MSIAQHFRKHKLNLFPSDPERSQMSLREDYERILKSIQVLAGEKEQETNKYAIFRVGAPSESVSLNTP